MSGIGVAAIQMAKALGSTVYVTAGSNEKCKFCQALGAAGAINYKTENFGEVIGLLTKNEGVNVILDMVGGDYTPGNIQSLADDGRLVMINTMNGVEHRKRSAMGSSLRMGPKTRLNTMSSGVIASHETTAIL